MDHVTVRRWVAASPSDTYKRLVDLDSLLAAEPDLDLLEQQLDPVGLHRGQTLVLGHRVGHRVTRLRLEVVDAEEPSHLAAGVDVRGFHWLLTVDIAPLDDGMSDVCLRASPEPGGRAPRLPVGARRAASHRRAVEAIERLLEAIARRLEGPVELPLT